MTFAKYFLAATAASCLAGTAGAATDTIDYLDNGAVYYFIPPATDPTASPYYRNGSQDWGWKHNAVAGAASSSSVQLYISNYDVDSAPCSFGNGTSDCEHDIIYGWDDATTTWLEIGELTGINDAYSFTEFNLVADLWDDVEAGLQVKMDIDAGSQGWIVTLAKSVITTDGDDPGNPNPGVNEVPLPAAGWLLIAGLGGLGAFSRRRKA